jgi:methylmalonyl-CoA/ethylmalonyl-CoA epimerase
VADLEQAIAFYEQSLGLKCYRIEEVTDQKVKTAFFQVGQTKIELLESMAPDGPIAKFIEKRGEGLHHLAFAVKNIEQQLEEVSSKGVQLIDSKPRKGAEGLDIAFLHPKSTKGVLVEFCEKR